MAELELLKKVAALLEEKKAQDLEIIDLRKKSSLTDFFVICSASSEIHAKSMADWILEKVNLKPVSVEGYEQASWILIDFGSVIVHIFKPEVRQLYALENLWMDAPRLTL